MKVCSYCGRENEVTITNCGECGSDLPDSESVIASPQIKPKILCPSCGTQDNYKSALALRSSFNLAVYVFGGFLAVLFHNASRKQKVQCNACGEIFGIHSPLSRVSLVIFWLLVGPTLIILGLLLFHAAFPH